MSLINMLEPKEQVDKLRIYMLDNGVSIPSHIARGAIAAIHGANSWDEIVYVYDKKD